MPALEVLLVEDDHALRDTLREAIEDAGYDVTPIADGTEAQDVIERRAQQGDLPDIVLIDVLLPGRSGLELLGLLRAQPGGDDVRAVVMSGIYRGARHQRNAREKFGVEAYLTKPVNLDELIDVLGQAPRVRSTEEALDDPLATAASKQESADVERVSSAMAKPAAAPKPTKKAPAVDTVASLKGAFAQKPFAEVLAKLYRARATGALMVREGRGKKIVYVDEGIPVFVKSNLLSECLGRVLVREKMITEDECTRSLTLLDEAKARGEAKQQGAILIDMGVISPHNLVYALNKQMELKLFEVFSWHDGKYQFSSKIELPPQSVRLEVTLADILLEGIRRSVPDDDVQQRLQPYGAQVLERHSDPLFPLANFSFESDERMFVSAVDGKRTTTQLIDMGLLETHEARLLLYTLLITQMVRPASTEPPADDDDDDLEPEVPPRPHPPTKAAAPSTPKAEALPPKAPSKPPPKPQTPKPSTRPTRPPPRKASQSSKSATPSTPADDGPAALHPLLRLDATALRTVLSLRLKKGEVLGPFERLQLHPDATLDEVERAVRAEHVWLRSDVLKTAPSDVRAMAKQLEEQLDDAAHAIRSGQVALYTPASAHAGDDKSKGAGRRRLLQASDVFQRGRDRLQRSLGSGHSLSAPCDDEDALLEAAHCFEQAHRLAPDDGEMLSFLAWSRHRLQSKGRDLDGFADAPLTQLEEALPLCESAELPRVFHAELLAADGEWEAAQKSLQHALSHHPNSRVVQQKLQGVLRRETV